MKKLITVFICMLICLNSPIKSAAAEKKAVLPVEVKAEAAVLMDSATGKVLLKMNENEKLYPASVTKIMSLLLVVEALESRKIALTDMVETSPVAASKGGSQIWLKEGEQMSVDELLKATAVYSANDACTALGEHVAGSDEGFVHMMNERAKELGMKNTHFENCTGLDDKAENHLTTAYDIAIMSRELINHEMIKEYTTIWMDSLRDGKTELVNTNKLIRFYSGATGLKTGTTSKAGCCVSATATREGTSLVAVVMGSENSSDRFEGAKALLSWGFANYSTVTPVIDKTLITGVEVLRGEERELIPQIPPMSPVLVKKGREKDIKQNIELATSVEAPVESNQTLGKITVSLDGEVIGEYKLTAPHYVDKLSFPVIFRRMLAVLCKEQ